MYCLYSTVGLGDAIYGAIVGIHYKNAMNVMVMHLANHIFQCLCVTAGDGEAARIGITGAHFVLKGRDIIPERVEESGVTGLNTFEVMTTHDIT
jgi:hypothetical protein